MSAHYDSYDYPSYWVGREYEHQSEILAVKSFFDRIPKIKTVLEIGCGFGRLVGTFSHRAQKIILSDPSLKLLNISKRKYKNPKKYKFLQLKLQNLNKRIKKESVDVCIAVRILHHIEDIEKSFQDINYLLSPNGYLIIEFPNKIHFKENIRQFFKGDFTYPLDIFSKDRTSKKNIKKKTLPFINYHPDFISNLLKNNGFLVLEKRSVSNFRLSFAKSRLSLNTLLLLEKVLQIPLAYINFGPSIFILAKKRG